MQAYRYRPRAVRHVGATKVFYACQMRVLVSDLTLNSLDDPRDRVKLELGLEATYQKNCAMLRFWCYFGRAQGDDPITRQRTTCAL